MQKTSSTTSPAAGQNEVDPFARFVVEFEPTHVQRKVAARWDEWEPWVLLDLHRRPGQYDPELSSAELARRRRQHCQDVLALLDLGIEMRLIRKHKLDDPRVTAEERSLRRQDALWRKRKAQRSRNRRHRNVDDARIGQTPSTTLETLR